MPLSSASRPITSDFESPGNFMQYSSMVPTIGEAYPGNHNASSPPRDINVPLDYATHNPVPAAELQPAPRRRRASKPRLIVPTSMRTEDNINFQMYNPEFTPSPASPYMQLRESEAGPSTSASSRDRATPYTQGRVDLDSIGKGRLILRSPEDERHASSSEVSSHPPFRTSNDQGSHKS